MRIDLDGDPSVAQLLARTRAQVLAAQRHQDLPFDQVVEAVKPPRSLSHTPIFQVTFAWQNAPGGELALDGLELTSFEMPQETAQTDLTLALGKTERGIEGLLSYATALFDRATVERVAATFERVLRAAAAGDADAHAVARLPLLGGAERAQVVTQWNATAAAYPADRCAHELFEDQAARTPDALALADAGRELSYRELDEQANRLARTPARARRGRRVARRDLHRSQRRDGDRDARHAQGGRRLPAARSGAARRARRVHARRRRAGRAAGRRAPAAPPSGPGPPSTSPTRWPRPPDSASASLRATRSASARAAWRTSSTPPARPASPRAC